MLCLAPASKKEKALRTFAKEMRRKMTKEERHLWFDFLRGYPLRFQRQKIMGDYILDFYCAAVRLAIELDGSQHYEPEAVARDKARTAWLAEQGVKVIRFANLDIWSHFEDVKEAVHNEVQERGRLMRW